MSNRTAAVYIAVLMSSLIVASIAMGAVTAAHYYARDLNYEGDHRLSQLAAVAALEWAVSDLNATTNWRTAHTNNRDTAVQQLGNARFRYRLIDVDGDLADDSWDACDIIATASVGKATCAWRARLQPAGGIPNCLNYSLSANNNIELDPLAMWCSDGIIGTGGNVVVDSVASLTADCYYAGSVSGNIYGTLNPMTADLEIPSVSVLEHYAENAVPIAAAQIPSSMGRLIINRQLLSSASNTISGSLSPDGVYVIDCENYPITISNSRLLCTLILENVGSNSKIAQSVFWEAAQANYPALLVDGDLELSMARNVLNEATLGINLNPTGTPYRGTTDSSLTTVYPSQIRGLIYVSGRIVLSGIDSDNEVHGVLIGGEKILGSGDLFLSSRRLFSSNPPPGFRKYDKVRIAPGSARRVLAP